MLSNLARRQELLAGGLGGQNPAFGAPVIGREKVGLGLDAMLGEGLPDQLADGGSVAASKR